MCAHPFRLDSGVLIRMRTVLKVFLKDHVIGQGEHLLLPFQASEILVRVARVRFYTFLNWRSDLAQARRALGLAVDDQLRAVSDA